MKKNIYISLIAVGVAFFASCKKEEMMQPSNPANSNSLHFNKVDSDTNGDGVIDDNDEVGSITVGKDSRDRNGTGSGGITVGKDSRDRNGTSSTGKLKRTTTGGLLGGSGNNRVNTSGDGSTGD